MGPGAIIILHVREKHMAQVPLAEHDDMVKTFPSDRADQPFSMSIFAMAIAARLAGHECPSREDAG
jgi:hypothetical protein